MIHPRIDQLLENVNERYALVIVAAKRARQINNYHHQLGEGIGPAALDVAEPRALRSEQHRGPAAGTGREREVPDHRQTVGRVLDRTRRRRRHGTGL